MATVVSIFFFIYIARQQTKKIKETRFSKKETKEKICFKSHKKIKVIFVLKEKDFFKGAALEFLCQENKDSVAQSPFRRENEMLSRRKALFLL